MGTFAGRGARFDHESIAESMRPALETMFNARIQIVDPNRSSTTEYNPTTDTGGESTSTVIYDSGVNGAEIQPIRSPTMISFGDQSIGILGVRIQCKMPDDTVGRLRSGLRVIVIDGGNDHRLEEYHYALNEGVATSITWHTIIEASLLTTGL